MKERERRREDEGGKCTGMKEKDRRKEGWRKDGGSVMYERERHKGKRVEEGKTKGEEYMKRETWKREKYIAKEALEEGYVERDRERERERERERVYVCMCITLNKSS